MVRVRYTFLLKSFTPDQWSLNFLFKRVASLISTANRIGQNTSGHHPFPGDAQSSLFNPLSNWKITIIYIGKHLRLTCHWEHRFTRCQCHPGSAHGVSHRSHGRNPSRSHHGESIQSHLISPSN